MTRGYTLIEALVYVFLVALLATVIVSLLLVMSRSFINFRLLNSLSGEAATTLERLTREIKQADSVNTLSNNPGRLVLNTTASGGGATTIEFYASAGGVLVKEGAGAAASTTSSRVVVNSGDLVFTQINTAESQAVGVELTVRQTTGGTRSEKYYTTAVLRGSY